MIRLLIAEDNPIVRAELVRLLGNQQDISIAAAESNGQRSLERLRSGVECDIVLADLSMPVMDGFEFSLKLKKEFPMITVIVLTMHTKEDFVRRAREAGVAGYLLKHLDGDELCDSIRLISTGIELYMY
ncbi:response regulator [Pedobacter terrae]|uniref:response regulator n=1 Tax=Pedobacter terrae TaxID=405671 RepID=UPI002FF586D5